MSRANASAGSAVILCCGGAQTMVVSRSPGCDAAEPGRFQCALETSSQEVRAPSTVRNGGPHGRPTQKVAGTSPSSCAAIICRPQATHRWPRQARSRKARSAVATKVVQKGDRSAARWSPGVLAASAALQGAFGGKSPRSGGCRERSKGVLRTCAFYCRRIPLLAITCCQQTRHRGLSRPTNLR